MPRSGRLVITGYPHHVIQRGHNRQEVFTSDEDYRYYLDNLREWKERLGCRLYAYCLMTNHVHLVLDPGEQGENLSLLMKRVAGRQTRFVNCREKRSGTLWEGRYKSTLIESGRYLLTCMAYIDLNPVRAQLAANPADYAWSSYGHYAGLRIDKLLTPHPLVWGLGNTPFAREAAYVELVQAGLTSAQHATLTDAVLRGWALGEPEFLEALQKKTARRVRKGLPGRPPLRLE